MLTYDAPSPGWQDAALVSLEPRLKYPYQQYGDYSVIMREQDFVQRAEMFVPLANNTQDGNFYLIEETPRRWSTGGIVEWTRVFGTVGNQFTHVEWQTVKFPGFYKDYVAGGANFRAALTQLVPVTVTHTFEFNTTPSSIVVSATPFLITDTTGAYVDYVDDTTSTTYAEYQNLIAANTHIVVRYNDIRPTYGGLGNVWEQTKYSTPAV